MTKYAQSRFSVGSNSKDAQRNFSKNYDKIFGKKKHQDPLKSLPPEELEKVPVPTDEELQAALDQGRAEADAFLGGGRK